MAGYVKLFQSILDSSVWELPPPIFKVWATLLAMKDVDGVVSASVGGLARRALLEREIVEEALAIFLAPDPDSRSKDFEGRRIEEVDGGWRVLNHEYYRDLQGSDDRRKKNAERQQRFRDRQREKDAGKGGGIRSVDDGKNRVYFMLREELVKIGYSRNPWARLYQLNAGSPAPATMLGHVPGTVQDEHGLHMKYGSFWSQGEWFKADPRLLEELEGFCKERGGTWRPSEPSNARVTPVTPYRSDADQIQRESSVTDPTGISPSAERPQRADVPGIRTYTPAVQGQQTEAPAVQAVPGERDVSWWFTRFDRAWCDAKGRLKYGRGTERDSKARGELGEILADLPPAERLAAETAAPAMLAMFLGEKGELERAEHPWSWFVGRFNGLRAKAGKKAGGFGEFSASEYPDEDERAAGGA